MRAALAIFAAASVGGCQGPGDSLPGSASFPLVPGSALAECPIAEKDERTRCVTIPADDKGKAIFETYKRLVHERGYRFSQYISGRNIAVLVKKNGSNCDKMIMGFPQQSDQRTLSLLEFKLVDPIPAEECATP